MPNNINKILSADKAEILGIYGQMVRENSVILMHYDFTKVMIGADLDQSLEDYMDMGFRILLEIFADFNIFMDSIVFEMGDMIKS